MNVLLQLFTLRFSPIRRILLQHLSPWDTARFLYIIKEAELLLSKNEKKMFPLNPFFDIFEDWNILNLAIRHNISITLFGNSLPFYFRRLQSPAEFLHARAPGPVFAVFRSNAPFDALHPFSNNPLVYEASVEHMHDCDSDQYRLSKWIRVEPICSMHFISCQANSSNCRGTFDNLDSTTVFQDAFWWDPCNANAKGTSACFSLAFSPMQKLPHLLSYITIGPSIDLRCVNVPEYLLQLAITSKEETFTLHTSKMASLGDLPELLGSEIAVPTSETRLDNYTDFYKHSLVLSLSLQNGKRLDLSLPDTTISYTSY